MSVNWGRFSRLIYGTEEQPFFSQIADIKEDARSQRLDSERGKLVKELREAHPAERRDLLISRMRERIVTVLGLESSDELASHRGFFDMGMDSLMALELKNALQSDLAVSIAPTLVFEHPTIEDLSDYLLKEVLHLETIQPQPAARAMAAGASVEMAGLSDHELLDRIEELSEEQVDEMLAGFAKNREIGDGNESL
jgi:acyl carrier protein